MKTRKKTLEEEAKKDPNYRPTEELDEDESQLDEEDKKRSRIPLTPIIIIGALVVLIIVCVVVIFCLGKPK